MLPRLVYCFRIEVKSFIHDGNNMFQTLTNVQRGESVPLQQYIDNCSGDLLVGLRSITYTVGWFNIGVRESVSWRNGGGPPEKSDFTPGLYSFETLFENMIQTGILLTVSQVNGLIKLTVNLGWEIQLTDGLLTLLELDDGFGGKWLGEGTYIGDRPVNFTPTKVLHVHLEQLNTTTNIVDGAPSQVLTTIPIQCHSFGDINAVRIEHPEYKHLRNGSVGELKVMVRDKLGVVIDNHDLPISLILEIKK